jgi:membrane protease YdiL (CAAX protease family)
MSMSATAQAARDRWFVAGYCAAYLASMTGLWMSHHTSAGQAAALLVILGVLFPGIALLVTRRAIALPHLVSKPLRETLEIVAYMVPVAAVLVAGFDRVNRITAEPLHSLVLLALKLVTFVLAPAALLLANGGYTISDLAPMSLRRRDLRPALWMLLLIIAFQAVAGRGLHDIQSAGLSRATLLLGAPLAFVWLLVEVGLVEEFFVRAVLQARMAALLKSEWGGLAVATLLFGLLHAPGFYLRTGRTLEFLGDHPSMAMAIAYSIGVTSIAGLFMGVLWMRTKNLAVVILVHAAGDWLPNLVPWLKAFHLTR